MYSYNQLQKVANQYNPDHDIGPDAPVQYQTYVLIAAIQNLIGEVEELKQRIAELETEPTGSNPFILTTAEIERTLARY